MHNIIFESDILIFPIPASHDGLFINAPYSENPIPIDIEKLKGSKLILGGNISQILVSFADTAVAGRYSTVALGAISVASAIVMTVTIGAIGLILSVSPVISNFRGQNMPAKKYFNFPLLREKLNNFSKKIIQNSYLTIAHGDYCFSNILIDRNNYTMSLSVQLHGKEAAT